jgi:hypothetical protein
MLRLRRHLVMTLGKRCLERVTFPPVSPPEYKQLVSPDLAPPSTFHLGISEMGQENNCRHGPLCTSRCHRARWVGSDRDKACRQSGSKRGAGLLVWWYVHPSYAIGCQWDRAPS